MKYKLILFSPWLLQSVDCDSFYPRPVILAAGEENDNLWRRPGFPQATCSIVSTGLWL